MFVSLTLNVNIQTLHVPVKTRLFKAFADITRSWSLRLARRRFTSHVTRTKQTTRCAVLVVCARERSLVWKKTQESNESARFRRAPQHRCLPCDVFTLNKPSQTESPSAERWRISGRNLPLSAAKHWTPAPWQKRWRAPATPRLFTQLGPRAYALRAEVCSTTRYSRNTTHERLPYPTPSLLTCHSTPTFGTLRLYSRRKTRTNYI